MTTRGKAIREQGTRGEDTPEALPYLKGSFRRKRIQPATPPEAFRPFLDALAELLAAEAVRRMTVPPGTQGIRKPPESDDGRSGDGEADESDD